MEDLIIVGSGCAGLTAAVYAARANCNPLVLEGDLPGGQLTQTTEVENFPGFHDGILGFDLTQNIRKQAEKFGARFASENVLGVELEDDVKIVKTNTGVRKCRALIIATGASPRFLNVPGEMEMYGGKGISACAICDGVFFKDKEVAVIGGGDSACEEALFLTKFCTKVTLIHRRDQLRASKIMASRVLENEKIEVVWNSVVDKFVAGEDGNLAKICLKNREDGGRSELSVGGAFLAIGHIPNTSAFKGLLSSDKEGYILTKCAMSVVTDIPGLFAAGDCVDRNYRQAITAAGMGCQAALEAERWLNGV